LYAALNGINQLTPRLGLTQVNGQRAGGMGQLGLQSGKRGSVTVNQGQGAGFPVEEQGQLTAQAMGGTRQQHGFPSQIHESTWA
jgi:hypothetical protein